MPLTSDLPFWAVLRPETDTVLAWTVAVVLLVQLYETGTKGGAPLLHGLICKPLVWVPGLGRGVIRTPSEAVVLGLAIGGRLEHVMGCGDLKAVVSDFAFQRRPSPRSPRHTYLGVQCGQKFLLRIPCAVYPTAAGLLGAGDSHGVGSALGRLLLELLGLDEVRWLCKEHRDG